MMRVTSRVGTFSSHIRICGTQSFGSVVSRTFSTKEAKVDAKVESYDPPSRVQKVAHINSFDKYKEMYKHSSEKSDSFWSEQAKQLDWFKPFSKVTSGGFGEAKWFIDGKINASYNCIDRHLSSRGDKIAILWEGDNKGDNRKITYNELHKQVNKLANALKAAGVKKGDTVVLYMPNSPEAVYAMLACTRIGALHSVIFAGFSVDAISTRIQDAKAKIVITASSVKRGGKTIPLKTAVDEALEHCPGVTKVFVWKREGDDCPMKSGRDESLSEVMAKQSDKCEPEKLDSEDGMFILYTSGSTGKPKGLLHTTGGYLAHAMTSFKYVFDYHDKDIYACLADVGWITGHSYIVYGPLLNGATTFLFEGIPTYPDADRYWSIVQNHHITQLYISPTAIRTLMKFGNKAVKSDRSTLRVLGSVGEPLNGEAWKWLYEVVGKKQCAIVDTYWQTETGGIMLTNIPGAQKMKPAHPGLPFFGTEPVILDSKTGKPLEGAAQGALAYKNPWPGIARTVYGDHNRYHEQYLNKYKGFFDTGDEAKRDADGYFRILGRTDDELNVSGHRIGSAELESALLEHDSCAEAAVIGFPHSVKGQGIVAYCVIKTDNTESPELEEELRETVRRIVGHFAAPDIIILSQGLPKTRSGKIMRRILRKIAANESSPEELGDISTLADPEVVQELIDKFKAHSQPQDKKSKK